MIPMRKRLLLLLVLAETLIVQHQLFSSSAADSSNYLEGTPFTGGDLEEIGVFIGGEKVAKPPVLPPTFPDIFPAVIFSGAPTDAGAPAPLAKAQAFFTEEELATLPAFANAVFKNIPEGVFNPSGPITENAYIKSTLSRQAAFTAKLIDPAMLNDMFETYINTFSFPDMNYEDATSWLNENIPPFFSDGTSDFEERKEAFVEKKTIYWAGGEPQTVLFMGDIHGSLHALLRNLLAMQAQGYINDDFSVAKNVHLVFLGDMVDRGLHGIECVYTILRLKNTSWDNVHLVRGNHEDYGLTNRYGFFEELCSKYKDHADDLYVFYGCFCTSLPSALFLGFYDEIAKKPRFMQCCHGGLVPYHDPKNLLSSSDALFERLAYTNPIDGLARVNAHQYEWNDTCCKREAEQLAFVDSDETLNGIPLDRIPWAASDRSGDGFPVHTIHRDDITKILRATNLFMLMRGHQDQLAPCKVLREGFDAPISWRAHSAFRDITPQLFLENGIPLNEAPNCLTLTTASDARGLFAEGFVKIWFNGNFETSRLQVYEPNLMPAKNISWWVDAQKMARTGIADETAIKIISEAAVSRHGKFLSYTAGATTTAAGGAGAGAGSGSSGPVSAGPGVPPAHVHSFPMLRWGNSSIAGLLSSTHTPATPVEPKSKPLPFYFGPGSINDTISKAFPGNKSDD
jgi:hypothetical protein